MIGPASVIIDSLSSSLNFSYSLVAPLDGNWGASLPNGTWTGMFGMLQKNTCDLVSGPSAMTPGRWDDFHMSSLISMEDLSLLSGIPGSQETNIFKYLSAFYKEVWLAFIGSFILFVMLGCYFMRVLNKLTRITNYESQFFVYLRFVCCEATNLNIPWSSDRLLKGTFLLAMLILTNSFSGQMKAAMMLPSKPRLIDSVADLAEMSHVAPVILKASAPAILFKKAKDEAYQNVWQRIVKQKGLVTFAQIYSPTFLRRVLQGRAAIIMDGTSIKYAIARACHLETGAYFHLAEQKLFHVGVYFACRRDASSTFKNSVDARILWLYETGHIYTWLAKAQGDWLACSIKTYLSTTKETEPLSMIQFSSLLILWTMFIGLSVAAIVAEILCKSFLT